MYLLQGHTSTKLRKGAGGDGDGEEVGQEDIVDGDVGALVLVGGLDDLGALEGSVGDGGEGCLLKETVLEGVGVVVAGAGVLLGLEGAEVGDQSWGAPWAYGACVAGCDMDDVGVILEDVLHDGLRGMDEEEVLEGGIARVLRFELGIVDVVPGYL